MGLAHWRRLCKASKAAAPCNKFVSFCFVTRKLSLREIRQNICQIHIYYPFPRNRIFCPTEMFAAILAQALTFRFPPVIQHGMLRMQSVTAARHPSPTVPAWQGPEPWVPRTAQGDGSLRCVLVYTFWCVLV